MKCTKSFFNMVDILKRKQIDLKNSNGFLILKVKHQANQNKAREPPLN